MVTLKVIILILGLFIGFACGAAGAPGDYGYYGASAKHQDIVREDYPIFKLLWSNWLFGVVVLLGTPIGYMLWFMIFGITMCFWPGVTDVFSTYKCELGTSAILLLSGELIGYFPGHIYTDSKLDKTLKYSEE